MLRMKKSPCYTEKKTGRHNKNMMIRKTILLLAMLVPLRAAASSGGSTDSQWKETQIGRVTADAVRYVSGSDIALVDGGLISDDRAEGYLAGGTSPLPLQGDRQILTAELSPAELTALLETAVSRIVVGEDYYIDAGASHSPGFAQISGFSFTYDPSAPVGSRIVRLQLADGSEPDLRDQHKTLSASVTDHWQEVLPDAVPTGITVSAAMKGYASASRASSEAPRISTIGTRDSSLVSEITPANMACGIGVLAVLAAAAGVMKRSRSGGRR